MGFNSTVLFLNDTLDQLRDDPLAGRKIYDAILMHNRKEKQFLPYGMQVIDVQHADTVQILAVGGNYGRVLGYGYWKQDDDSLVKSLNNMRLERKRKAKYEEQKAKDEKPKEQTDSLA